MQKTEIPPVCAVGGNAGKPIHDRVADDGESPVFFYCWATGGMFPGRILANPFGGNCYYRTREEAEAAAAEILRKKEAGEMI